MNKRKITASIFLLTLLAITVFACGTGEVEQASTDTPVQVSDSIAAPVATATPTPVATATAIPTPVATATAIPTPVATATAIPTPVATATAIPTPTAADETLTFHWGKTTEEPEVFPADDVEQSTTDLVLEWAQIGIDTWGNYGPLEIYIVGNGHDAAKKLEDEFCERHKKLDPKWRVNWDCASESDEILTGYVRDGGAAISSWFRDYIDYHFAALIMGPKYPFPDEEDYKVVTLHEWFHLYQHAHISDIEINGDKSGRKNKMGGEDKPWFTEGSAEFMAQLLYSKQPGVHQNYLKDTMRRKYDSVPDYFAYGKNLKDLTYSDSIRTYDIGTWFIAYLVHQFGEDTLVNDFYEDLDVLGFEGSFSKHFKASSDVLVSEFDTFIADGLEKSLEIIP